MKGKYKKIDVAELSAVMGFDFVAEDWKKVKDDVLFLDVEVLEFPCGCFIRRMKSSRDSNSSRIYSFCPRCDKHKDIRPTWEV